MWLYMPCISAPATEDSSLPSDRWGGYEPWLTLSGTPTRRPSSWNGWRRRGWITLLSGMTSPRSTVDRGAAEWTSSLPVSPANRSPLPGSSVELTMTAGSGRPSLPSSATWDRDSSCWRTSPSLFDSGSPMSSLTLPTSGSMRNGVCSQRPPLGLLTAVSESGSWPTPVARDTGRTEEAHLRNKAGLPGGPRTEATSLTVVSKSWPTPTAADGDRGSETMARGNPTSLGAAREWHTPTTTHGIGGGINSRGEPTLPGQAKEWPTPMTTDYKSASIGDTLRRAPGLRSVTIEPDGPTGSPRVDLNPFFVATLMGLPADWLTLSTSEVTASCRRQLLTPSGSSSPEEGGPCEP